MRRTPKAHLGQYSALPWTRRGFLGALGSGALAGSLDAFAAPKPPPLPGCAGTGPAPHARIDAHLHIFNGTDLQVGGFLSTSVAYEHPIVGPLLQLLPDPLQRFVWHTSPKATDELRRLNSLTAASGPGFAAATLSRALEEDRAETDAQYAEFLYGEFQKEEVRKELSALLGLEGVTRRGLVPRPIKAPANPQDARALADRVDRAGIPIFDYLKRYFSYRYANFFEAVDQFTCQGSAPIDTFIALMVDFDEPFDPGGETPSHISEQTTVVSKICELSRGRLLALAPYCPFKDVHRNGASLKNVLDAWTKKGFVGAKLYPPMGFRPYGNGDERDDALAMLYSHCIREDAVVVAHAESSLCIKQGNCESPGPEGWSAALDHVLSVERAPLRASLGHFGEPFSKPSPTSSWPQDFLGLMEKPSGQRLYADLGYASEVLDRSQQQVCIARLTQLLTEKGSVLSERLLYGTDWLMLGLESGWRNYLPRMESVIQGAQRASGIADLEERLFGANARAWLDLENPRSLASRNTSGL